MSDVVVKDEMLEKTKRAVYPVDPEEDLNGLAWDDVLYGIGSLHKDYDTEKANFEQALGELCNARREIENLKETVRLGEYALKCSEECNKRLYNDYQLLDRQCQRLAGLSRANKDI